MSLERQANAAPPLGRVNLQAEEVGPSDNGAVELGWCEAHLRGAENSRAIRRHSDETLRIGVHRGQC